MTSTAQLPRPTKSGKDAVLAGAIDRARDAAIEEGGEFVGEHLGFVLEDTRLGTHYFACTNSGYYGWYWAVTITRIPHSRTTTVCDSALYARTDSIMAKVCVQCSALLEPEHERQTDRSPYEAKDPRLEPGYTPTGDAVADHVAIVELGLDREWVETRQ